MKRIRKTLCCTANCAATLLLLGCYPRPHEFTRVPAITGVLVNAGKPLTGVSVYVAQNRGDDGNYCRDMRPVATTDSNGNFQIEPVIERHVWKALWDPAILTVLLQPVWLVFALPGLLLAFFASSVALSYVGKETKRRRLSESRPRICAAWASIPRGPGGIFCNTMA